MKLEKTKKLQDVFKSNLNKIVTKKCKSKEQENSLQNTKLLYEALKAVIKLFNRHYSIASAAKCIVNYKNDVDSWKRTELQMLQRLPIALAQIKEWNAPENLLNKIRQNMYSLY